MEVSVRILLEAFNASVQPEPFIMRKIISARMRMNAGT
jgi:hypothetical protein